VEAERPALSENDFGDWAEHYARDRGFYGHFKDDIYPVFIEILAGLPGPARILDIGAGPGNLAREFYKTHPGSTASFVLIDASRELLRIAEERLAGRAVTTLVRSFNMDGWHDGIQCVDAIVSNNALFHVRPERLEGFYASCFSLLKPGGVILNQQSFGYRDGESPYGNTPFPTAMRDVLTSVFPGMPTLSKDKLHAIEEEKKRAMERHAKALADAKAAGVEMKGGQSGYQFLSVERHLGAMRGAGLVAGCIWRKREFAVVCGVRPRHVA
jgi:SAM-dependent methyltransferase